MGARKPAGILVNMPLSMERQPRGSTRTRKVVAPQPVSEKLQPQQLWVFIGDFFGGKKKSSKLKKQCQFKDLV